MGQSYSETSDAEGRITLELHDDLPLVLFALCAAGVAPAFFFGEAALWFALANLMVFGSLSAWFTFARRQMRVTIDRAAATLALESGPKQRVLALGEVASARVTGAGPKAHRVELVLQSGEVLPLYAGLGGFPAEGCEHLARRIREIVST
jgi:hypothetical protein